MKIVNIFGLSLSLVIFGCANNQASNHSAPPTEQTAAVAKTDDPRPCMANFSNTGSFWVGQHFKTFEDFPRKSQAGAFDSLVPAVSAGGYQILNASKDLGIISAAQAVSYSHGAKSTPLNVSVRKNTPTGVRVEVVFSLAGGLAASTETIQNEFCRIIAAVNQSPDAPSAPVASDRAQAQPASSSATASPARKSKTPVKSSSKKTK